MFLKQKIKMFLLKQVLCLFAPFYRMKHPVPADPRKRIILIRNDFLGDFIVFLYSAFALRKALPAAEYCISVFVAENNVEWAKKSKLFDEVFTIPKNGARLSFSETMSQFFLIHSLPADMVINTLHGRDGASDLLAFVSPAKRKYAFSLSGWQQRYHEKIMFYEYIYTRTFPLKKESSLIDSTCELFQMAIQKPAVPVPLAPEQIRFLENPAYPVKELPHPYCVIVPGSNFKRRNWSAENFVETARQLKREYPCLHFVVSGVPAEKELCRTVSSATGAVDLCGELSLSDLASVLHHAACCLSNETGSAHLAAAFGVPTFCILSGQHFALYAPCPYRPELFVIFHRKECFSCNGNCFDPDPEAPFPCLAEISPGDVLQTIRAHPGAFRSR